MHQIKIALDWTPTVNHIGILIAHDKGFYLNQQLQVDIENPITDNYNLTPGKKLSMGLVDFAIAPFETVISLNNKQNKVEAKAVYAILQKDLSCIVTLANSGIQSPKELDHKIYASYKARYEDFIVQEMVKANGGKGNLNLSYPDKLGIWETLLTGKADATWIFDNWEGVEAEMQQVALNKFYLHDYGIPYGYSPVIVANGAKLSEYNPAYSKFIQATQHGYIYAQQHPSEAAEILSKHVTERDRMKIDVFKTIERTAPHFGNAEKIGRMHHERVQAFLHWLVKHQLEKDEILNQNLFTNELLNL